MDWNEWLDERIDYGRGAPQPRWRVIRFFVRQGLIPFVATHGYDFAPTAAVLEYRVACGLWENASKSHTESDWSSLGGGYISEKEEDEWHYHHILSSTEWEVFWDRWAIWRDVSDISFRGHDRRLDIQAFVWTQLNLETSPQTQVVRELCGEVESPPSTDRGRGWKEDVYLREAAESNQYDGWRV
jgi:hypothetical protein